MKLWPIGLIDASLERNDMNSPPNTLPYRSRNRRGWTQVIPSTIATLLLLSSFTLPAIAFGASHSTGRSHSASSSHVGSHRKASSVQRNKHGRIRRSSAAKHSFEREHPCPSTGRTSGRCPGYVVDHVNPLECGGADASSNMQWQTVAAGKAEDKTEGRCR